MITPGQANWIIRNLRKKAPRDVPPDRWQERHTAVVIALQEMGGGPTTLAPDANACTCPRCVPYPSDSLYENEEDNPRR